MRHTGRTATTEVKPMNDPDLLGDQVRAWIDAHFDPGMSLHSWLELLADSGWAAPAWPAAWYGKGLPADLAAVAIAEFGAAGVPGPPAGLGSLLVAPTIIAHGSDELKRKYLRAVLTGEHAWCQLFSEPGAGSDLASLATRAERDGEDFVIDGRRGAPPRARPGRLWRRRDGDARHRRGTTNPAGHRPGPGAGRAGPSAARSVAHAEPAQHVERAARPGGGQGGWPSRRRGVDREADGLTDRPPVARYRRRDLRTARHAGRPGRTARRRGGDTGAGRAGAGHLRRLRPDPAQRDRRARPRPAEGTRRIAGRPVPRPEKGDAGTGSPVVMTTFVFTDEQQGLRDLARRFLAEKSPVSEVRRLMATEAGDDAVAQADLLPAIASGETIATLAVAEDDGSWAPDEFRVTARRSGDRYLLNGRKSFVLDGMIADPILVAASSDDGPALFAVDGDTLGLSRQAMQTLDMTRKQAVLTFSGTPGRLVCHPAAATEIVAQAIRGGVLALAAEQVGGAQRCLDMAVAYAKVRHQFGRAIGRASCRDRG